MSGRKPIVSFLVGAGLSIDADLPGSIELADKFKKALLGDEKPLNHQVDNAALLELYRFLDGGIRFRRGIVNDDPDRPINIEELGTAALYLKSRLDSPTAAYVSGWHNRLIEIETRNP